MALAPIRSVILGSLAFMVFWITATFPKFPGLPIGRTAGAVVGATLMVVFQVESPNEAYASVNLPILGLLFGTMVVSIYLQRADMFRHLTSILCYRCRGGKDLLCRLSFLVALCSALFTNDTCCVLFTEFILIFCKEKGLPPEPFLLALASSANIGSSATPIGNPQNLVIAIQSKISFGKFLIGILPAMLVGITLNLCLLLGVYWNQLSMGRGLQRPIETNDPFDADKTHKQAQQWDIDVEEGKEMKVVISNQTQQWDIDGEEGKEMKDAISNDNDAFHNCQWPYSRSLKDGNDSQDTRDDSRAKQLTSDKHTNDQLWTHPNNEAFPDEGVGSSQPDRTSDKEIQSLGSQTSPAHAEQILPAFPNRDDDTNVKSWRWYIWKTSVYLVTLGMLAALLAGLNLSWSTITAAIALTVLDFQDAGPSLSKVSYSILVFFSGMFITVDGFNRTGLPATFWNAMEPHAQINHASGTAVLTGVIILLSNIASNVPTVLLLGPKVAASSAALPGAGVTRAWLILAWVSTVAGNLTLVGSAANLIVCEQARTAPGMPYRLSFWRHLKFGFPSTLLTVAVGLPLIRA